MADFRDKVKKHWLFWHVLRRGARKTWSGQSRGLERRIGGVGQGRSELTLKQVVCVDMIARGTNGVLAEN